MGFRKEKTIPLSKYFELINPKYVYLKITPDKSIIEEQNTNTIAKSIKATYKNIFHKIRIENKKLFIEADFKISYIIDMNKDDVSFIFMIPALYYESLFEKISSIWQRSTYEVLEGIPEHTKNVKCYKLVYRKEDALSFNVDGKGLLMEELLSNTQMLQDDDRITIVYNFMPCSDFNWTGRYDSTIEKIYRNKSVLRNKFNLESFLLGGIQVIQDILDEVFKGINDFLGDSGQIKDFQMLEILKRKFNLEFTPSYYTKTKRDCGIINCQMVYLVDGKDKARRDVNAMSVKGSFRALDGDNILISKKVKKNFKLEDYRFANVETNVLSTTECSALVQLPTKQQSTEYEVEYVDVTQEQVPEKLTHGYLKLGQTNYKGELQEAYFEDSYNIGNLPIVLCGSQGSGKTTYMGHIYKYAATRREGGVVIDFIKNNEMTDDILEFVPKDMVILLDYSEEECLQSFAFNELKLDDTMKPFRKRELVSLQAERILDLVDAVNPNKPLEPRMRRYLSASANVVFATGEGSLREVVRCLQDPDSRNAYIQKVSEGDMFKYLRTKIDELNELTDYKKDGIGNKDDRVSGILDRISLLREDFKLECMFDKDPCDNINFVDELEKGKLILIKMPQADYSDHAKDIITTFFLSKIWLATEIRGGMHKYPNRTIVSIDEIHKTPIAHKIVAKKNIIQQTRKYGCKFVLSCQAFSQIPSLIGSCIEGGASFMLLKGTELKDFNLLKDRMPQFDYSDITNMELYYSLNIVNYSDGYASFITKLPYEKEVALQPQQVIQEQIIKDEKD